MCRGVEILAFLFFSVVNLLINALFPLGKVTPPTQFLLIRIDGLFHCISGATSGVTLFTETGNSGCQARAYLYNRCELLFDGNNIKLNRIIIYIYSGIQIMYIIYDR